MFKSGMGFVACLALVPLSSPCTREFVHPSHPDFAFQDTPGREWVSSTDLPLGGNPLAWPYRTGFLAGRVVVPRRWSEDGVTWDPAQWTECRYATCGWLAPTTWTVELEHIYWINESMVNAPTGLLRPIPGTVEVLDSNWVRVAFVAEGIPLLPTGPNVITIRHDPEYLDQPPYERAGIMVFEVDPDLLVVPVTVHIGVDANAAPIVDDETVREWFGEFRGWDKHEVTVSGPPDYRLHRYYTEYTTSRPWTTTISTTTSGDRYNDYDLGRPMERVEVVFAQCRVGFSVEVVHHDDLLAAWDEQLRDERRYFPTPQVMGMALPDRVNVFVAGRQNISELGATWHNLDGKRIILVTLEAMEKASLNGDYQRVLAHEVGHALGHGGHDAASENLMYVSGWGADGGVLLDDDQCTLIRADAAEIGVPVGEL